MPSLFVSVICFFVCFLFSLSNQKSKEAKKLVITSYSYPPQVPTSKDFTYTSYTRALLNLFRNVMKYIKWWKIDWT